MTKKMFIHFDKEADYLEVRFGKPTPSNFEDMGNDVFRRLDEKTGQVTGYAFFNVQKRGKGPKDIAVDIPVISS